MVTRSLDASLFSTVAVGVCFCGAGVAPPLPRAASRAGPRRHDHARCLLNAAAAIMALFTGRPGQQHRSLIVMVLEFMTWLRPVAGKKRGGSAHGRAICTAVARRQPSGARFLAATAPPRVPPEAAISPRKPAAGWKYDLWSHRDQVAAAR